MTLATYGGGSKHDLNFVTRPIGAGRGTGIADGKGSITGKPIFSYGLGIPSGCADGMGRGDGTGREDDELIPTHPRIMQGA